MELYGSFTSPFVRHCRIALAESGLDFHFVEADATVSARLSPTQKLPFLKYTENGVEKMLTDSSAILKYIREKSGAGFFSKETNALQDYNNFCTANTIMDSAINLFYLEKDGLTPAQSAYLTRQQSRMESGLTELEKITYSTQVPFSEAELRIACFLEWALFRQRISLAAYPNLTALLANINKYALFANTAPK